MIAGVLDLHFLDSIKKHRKTLGKHGEDLEKAYQVFAKHQETLGQHKQVLGQQREDLDSLSIKLQGLENAVFEAKAGASASFNKKIETVFKNYCKELDQKSEEFEEAIYTSKMSKQTMDSMIPYWSNRLLEQDGKLLDYDDKFSAINKRIVSQDNNYQEQTKLIDTLLEIIEGDINKEEALNERLTKLEVEIARICKLMAKQVIEPNPLQTKSSMVSIPLENVEKTFIETKPIVITETLDSEQFEKPKPIAKPGIKWVSEGKENKSALSNKKTTFTPVFEKNPIIPSVDKKTITSEYSKYFSDKTVQKVEVNLFDVEVEKKTEPKKPIKHSKTKSVDIDQFKKK
jgi:chromosome segregation ATPase